MRGDRRSNDESCNAVIRECEQAFRRILHECGDRPPQLLGIEVRHYPESSYSRICMSFVGIEPHLLGIRWHRAEMRAVEGIDPRALESLYSRLYEDHLVNLQTRRQRDNINRLMLLGAPDGVIRDAQELYYRTRLHAERHHGTAEARAIEDHIAADMQQALYGATLGTSTLADNAATAISVADLERAMRLMPQHSPETYRQNRMYWLNRQMFASVDGDYTIRSLLDPDTGSPEAEKKGMDLLKSWLTPKQADQYEKDHSFEVVGGDTGKRYRINHGRQMNITEVDGAGKRVCGWCFLPQGQLVAGDVMLAQKVALETNERAALAIANRF